MGRASSRKKMRREAAHPARRAMTSIQAQAGTQPELLAGVEDLGRAIRRHESRYIAACRKWYGSEDPVPAKLPQWARAPFGRRLLSSSTFFAQARLAPCLLTADVPNAAEIMAEPAHWNVATRALVRAVAFDGLEVGHQAVTPVLDVLAPVAAAEFAHSQAFRALLKNEYARAASRSEFPVLDGPESMLGCAALVEVTKALVSDHPAAEELAVLSRALDGTIPGVAGSVVAGAMINAARLPDLRELPSEVLRRFPPLDNPLEILVSVGVIAPGDLLRAGLSILTALIRLGESELAHPRRHAA